MSKQFYWAAFLMLWAYPVLLGQGAAPQHPASREVIPIIADIKSTLTLNTAVQNSASEYVQSGRYFRSRDGKSREDFAFTSVITNKRAGTMIFLNHARKEATLVPVTDAKVSATHGPANPSQRMSVLLGEGQVEGHLVQKKRMEGVYSGKTTEIWTAIDIQAPVLIKTIGSDRTTIKEYKNIQIIDPDPQLFEIPKDYRIVDKNQLIPPKLARP